MLRQFPDCRFLYVFFRSRTLGYDVYPEDHFLRSFPWQQYGGLWIVDDARFARSDKINPRTAQALRRITSEGSSPGSSMFNSSSGSGSYNSGPWHQYTTPSLPGYHSDRGMAASSRVPSYVSSFDGSMGGIVAARSSISGYLNPVFDMKGMHSALPKPTTNKAQAPSLSLITEIGKRFPGYPSPLSPTGDAKIWYPSPASECGSGIATPRARSPAQTAPQGGSPMSIDGSSMCGPSRRCTSHGYGVFVNVCGSNASDGGHPKPTGTEADSCYSFASGGKGDAFHGPPSRTATPTPSANSISPISPPRAVSPRTAMLKNMVGKQALQNMSHNPLMFSPKAQRHTWTCTNDSLTNLADALDKFNTRSHTPLSLSPPSIRIANGIETLIPSSPSGTGTMLSYTSNRAVDSGLLAVRPLSEAHVAEYRFWRPCGRRACAFGCGDGSAGECAAAKRLFRDEEEVRPEEPEQWEEEKFEKGYEP
jgi:hypothetical protein